MRVITRNKTTEVDQILVCIRFFFRVLDYVSIVCKYYFRSRIQGILVQKLNPFYSIKTVFHSRPSEKFSMMSYTRTLSILILAFVFFLAIDSVFTESSDLKVVSETRTITLVSESFSIQVSGDETSPKSYVNSFS